MGWIKYYTKTVIKVRMPNVGLDLTVLFVNRISDDRLSNTFHRAFVSCGKLVL